MEDRESLDWSARLLDWRERRRVEALYEYHGPNIPLCAHRDELLAGRGAVTVSRRRGRL
jgi:hypothetical protein